MSYSINLTNGSSLLTLADGTEDNTTSLTLVGRNFAGYGQAINTNFVRLLENASNGYAPSNPLIGQLWYNNSTHVMSVWLGNGWKAVGGSSTSLTAPVNAIQGDTWWNGVQFSVYNGSQWINIGPVTPPGVAVTAINAGTIYDTNSNPRVIGNLIVNNQTVGIVSSYLVPYNPTSAINGLTVINPGLNMVQNMGVTSPLIQTANIFVTGNANVNVLNSNLSNIATTYIGNATVTTANIVTLTGNSLTFTNANITSLATISSLTVRNQSSLNAVTAGNITVSSNVTVSGTAILNALTASSATISSLFVSSLSSTTVNGTLSVTGASSLSSTTVNGTLSATSLQQGSNQVLHAGNYNSYAPTLTGTGASGNWAITANYAAKLYGTGNSDYRQGDTTATAYSIAQRDGNGNLTSNYFIGTAIQAEYADLAERFASDAVYPVGTVMELGGESEVTQVVDELSERVFGVISTEAAYLMNSGAGTDDTHPGIALAGRVPVRVIGQVNKGDRLVSAGNGLARRGLPTEITPFNVIGRALGSKIDDGEELIEAIVRVNV